MIRIGGAQIPVTKNINLNVEQLKKAIDWASENKVDYLLTPEGALSGYMNSYDFLKENDLEVITRSLIQYASERNVGMALGTEYIERVGFGEVKRSQIRYYNETGVELGFYNKQMTIPGEQSYPGDGPTLIDIENWNSTGRSEFKIGSFICNDAWGQRDNQQIIINDLFYYESQNTNVLFHASNGFRGPDAGTEQDNVNLRLFSDMHLWMMSRYHMPIVTVDNCYTLNGEFYDGPTSSTSGVIHNGEWLVKAAPTGTDYFYHDFNF
jgi:predicted amidohydrolase